MGAGGWGLTNALSSARISTELVAGKRIELISSHRKIGGPVCGIAGHGLLPRGVPRPLVVESAVGLKSWTIGMVLRRLDLLLEGSEL